MIIGPRRSGSGASGSSGDDRNGGSSSIIWQCLGWCLHLDPLLGSCQVVACVPLVLSSCVRSGVADISIGDCAVHGSVV